MIQSIQKIIKVGSSGAVTIPAKEMKRQGVTFGEEIKISWEPAKKGDDKQQKLIEEYEKFKKQYSQTLKNLADR